MKKMEDCEGHGSLEEDFLNWDIEIPSLSSFPLLHALVIMCGVLLPSWVPVIWYCHTRSPEAIGPPPTKVFPQTFLFRIGFGQVFCYSGAKLASRAQELDVWMYLETGGRYVYLLRNFSQYFTNP